MGRPILSPGKKLTGEKTDRYTGRLQLLFYEWKSRGNTIIRPSYFNIDFLYLRVLE